MATGSEEMDKFVEKQRKEDLIDTIKWLVKILKGDDKE